MASYSSLNVNLYTYSIIKEYFSNTGLNALSMAASAVFSVYNFQKVGGLPLPALEIARAASCLFHIS